MEVKEENVSNKHLFTFSLNFFCHVGPILHQSHCLICGLLMVLSWTRLGFGHLLKEEILSQLLSQKNTRRLYKQEKKGKNPSDHHANSTNFHGVSFINF